MYSNFSNSVVTGIATAIPKSILELSSLSPLYGNEEVKKIIASTGIERIHVAETEQCASDLCEAAATALMNKLELDASKIDGIIFVSQTPDYILPATSALLQNRLGLPTTAVAFDINYGCSGYVYGLYQASLLIASGGCERVLLCAGDISTRLVHPEDRSIRMLFGDGGSATILEKGNNTSHFILKTDGSGAEQLIIPAGGHRIPYSKETSISYEDKNGNTRTPENIYMNGMEIMSFALREIPSMIKEILKKSSWKKDDVGTFAFHQANQFMLQYLGKKMRLNKENVPIAIRNVGNTGPASIPIMLSLRHGDLSKNNQLDKVVCCGFGVGLSWAACTQDLSSTVIMDPIEV